MSIRRARLGILIGGLTAVAMLGACSSGSADTSDDSASEATATATEEQVATQEATATEAPTQEATPESTPTEAPTEAATPTEEPEEEAEEEANPFGDETVADFFANKCAACHGANREGLVGPALLPERLTESDEFYAETIKNGREGTAMPSWGAQGVTDAQIEALVTFIKTEPGS